MEAEQRAQVKAAMVDLLTKPEALTKSGTVTAKALNAALGFEVSVEDRDDIFAEVKADEAKAQAAQGDKDDETGDDMEAEQPALSDLALETCVEVAALLMRRNGEDPAGALLLRKCGPVQMQEVENSGIDPDAVATWACAEARRRSPALEHKAIVANSIG